MTICPFAAWRPISENIHPGGRVLPLRGFVPHVQVGTGSLHDFFNHPKPPGQGASADSWISKTGVLEQYVSPPAQAWAQGSKLHNGNPTFWSCEFEGQPGEPMTAAQIDMGGRLIAWVHETYGPFPLVVNGDPEGRGITPHHVFGGGHTCPGPGPREGQYPALILAALRWLDPIPGPGPVPVPPLEEPMQYVYVRNPGGANVAARHGCPPIAVNKFKDVEYLLSLQGDHVIESESGKTTGDDKDPAHAQYRKVLEVTSAEGREFFGL